MTENHADRYVGRSVLRQRESVPLRQHCIRLRMPPLWPCHLEVCVGY